MSTSHTQRARDMLDQVLQRPVVERQAFLDRACAGDACLRAEVGGLLEAFHLADDFLEPSGTRTFQPQLSGGMVGRRVGRYTLLRLIATGGMGSVYEAQQQQPRRIVALKLMKSGIVSRSALRRFEYEAQLLGRLRHAHIAQIYEAGTHDEGTGSVPYFAMEYIPRAVPITDFAVAGRLSIGDRLKFFLPVCDAVYHGHQKGIIHRDLKPSNILVDSAGQPKIIDFGVARSTDSDLALTTMQTSVGQLIGTLQYMSPEQCAADPRDIDTRSDVYALGVVLYELLCGQAPYDLLHVPVHEATRIIREQHPSRLSTSNRRLRGDVETIVLKALEKDRERRYRSAVDLAEDIRRYLKGEAINARPPSAIYHLQVFARRHKAIVGALTAVFAVLLIGVVVSTSQYIRAEREAEEATAINAFFNDMLASIDPMQMHTLEAIAPGGVVSASTGGSLGQNLSIARMMRQASDKVGPAFAGKPELEARARERIGMTFKGLGLERDARPHLLRARDIRRAVHGDNHPDTWRSILQLATVSFMDKHEATSGPDEPLVRAAYEGLRRAHGDEHPPVLSAARILADVCSNQRKYDLSEPIFRRTLEVQRRVLGRAHRETLLTMLYWAQSCDAQTKTQRMQALSFEAYDISRRTLPPGDYVLLFAENMAALGYWYEGRFDLARRLFDNVFDKCRSTYDDNHMWTLWARRMAASSWPGEENAQQREHVYRQVLSALEHRLGGQHSEVTNSRHQLGALLVAGGRYDAALALLGRKNELLLAYVLGCAGRADEARAVLEALRAKMEEHIQGGQFNAVQLNGYAQVCLMCAAFDHRAPQTALSAILEAEDIDPEQDPYLLRTLAWAHELNGDVHRAAELQLRALSDLPPGASWSRTYFDIKLISLLRQTGAAEQAQRLRRAHLEHMRRAHGEVPAQLERQLTDVVLQFEIERRGLAQPLSSGVIPVRLLLAHGAYGVYDLMCNEITQLRRGVLPDSESGIATAAVSLAREMVAEGEYVAAEALLGACLAIQEQALPQGSWRIPETLSILGASLAGQHRFEDAERVLQQACDRMQADAHMPTARRRQALTRIINFYEAWGKPDQADQWRAKLRAAASAT